MGLLKNREELENALKELDKKLNYYIVDGDLSHRAAYISDTDGSLHVFNEKINGIEESKAICEWYLSVCYLL